MTRPGMREFECHFCHAPVWRYPSSNGRRSMEAERTGEARVFCSVACSVKGRRWRGNEGMYGSVKPGLEAKAHPTSRDIAWAAGIFEGEGSCAWSPKHRTLNAIVSQKDRWLLDRLRYYFGGTVAVRYERQGMHAWQIHGGRARGFLMTIYVFMSPRRKEQIRRALQIPQT